MKSLLSRLLGLFRRQPAPRFGLLIARTTITNSLGTIHAADMLLQRPGDGAWPIPLTRRMDWRPLCGGKFHGCFLNLASIN
jgi:hypothetical protein